MFQNLFSKNKSNRWAITDKMFLSLMLTGSIIEFSHVGAGFVDGLVISRMLGADAMAAQGIAYPIFSIVGTLSGLIAVGMQVRCSQSVGRGNRDEAERFFSAAVYAGGILSAVLAVLMVIFAKPFAALLGASGNAANLVKPASDYLIGVGIGIPALVVTAILAPAFQLDSGRKTIQTGALIEVVANIVLDITAAKLGWGLLGMGLATSAATYINLLYQCTHFLKKDRLLHFVKPGISVKDFLSMCLNGSEMAMRRLTNTLRPVILNTVIIAYGGTAAMSALSVRNNLYNFTGAFGIGIASAVLLLTGLYFGEINEEGIREVDSQSKKYILIFSGAICVLVFIFAPQIARLYITEDGEIFKMATFVIRATAIQNPLHSLVAVRTKYLQAIHRRLNMNLLIIASQLGIVLVTAFALGALFGVYGILACYAVSDFLSLAAVYVYYAIKTHRLFPKKSDFLNLPDEFTLSPGDVISLDIRDAEDVTLCSDQIMMFCKGHGIDRKTAYFSALSFEELAINIIKHGFPLNRSSHPIIDLRAVITENTFVIRMRDNCPQYDVTKHIAEANAEGADPTRNIGIRIVSKTASDVSYLRTFETNSMIIRFNLK